MLSPSFYWFPIDLCGKSPAPIEIPVCFLAMLKSDDDYSSANRFEGHISLRKPLICLSSLLWRTYLSEKSSVLSFITLMKDISLLEIFWFVFHHSYEGQISLIYLLICLSSRLWRTYLSEKSSVLSFITLMKDKSLWGILLFVFHHSYEGQISIRVHLICPSSTTTPLN